jgi:rfaE bifunctional protein nucleotidyltransferase chain/domain
MKRLIPTAKEHNFIFLNKYIEDEQHTKTDYKDKVCVKPWGYEFLVYESNKIGIWYLNMKEGHSTSLHTHFKKDTFLIVLAGCAKIGLIDNKYLVLNTMESLFIPKYKFHSISSFTKELVILEIEIFTSKLSFSDKNDLLRLEDQYKRKPIGYESSITTTAEGLDKYNHFTLSNTLWSKYGTSIQLNEVTTQQQLEEIKHKTYNILLEGTLFSDMQYYKEGTVVNLKEKIYQPVEKCVMLSVDKLLWEEDTKIIYNFDQLKLIKETLHEENKKIVLTSGCFDILHVGHLETLKRSKMLGDVLIVCLSSDEQIKALKGSSRPINNYEDRINLFKTITYVDYIVLYNEENIEQEETLGTIMKIVDPYTWVKGSDYNPVDILRKHPYLRNITILPLVDEKSTTNIVKKITET